MPVEKSLLLVVDVQRGFMNEATEMVVPKINRLIEAWNKRQWPVVCSRFVNLPASNWERLRDWRELQGEPATLPAEGLNVDGAHLFKKAAYSAWSTETQALCMDAGVRDVVIVGIDTNECVLATALAVFDAGFIPWVVQDCCASTGGVKPHEMALTLLRPLLGEQQIITSQELLNA